MTSTDIELELANYFNPRSNLIIPNVSWGFNIHECDLLVVSPAGYITEVEIKISKSDIRADLKKRHKHFDTRIKRLFFAIPYNLQDYADLIPEHAGILAIDDREGRPPSHNRVIVSRQAKEQQRIQMYAQGPLRPGTARITADVGSETYDTRQGAGTQPAQNKDEGARNTNRNVLLKGGYHEEKHLRV